MSAPSSEHGHESTGGTGATTDRLAFDDFAIGSRLKRKNHVAVEVSLPDMID